MVLHIVCADVVPYAVYVSARLRWTDLICWDFFKGVNSSLSQVYIAVRLRWTECVFLLMGPQPPPVFLPVRQLGAGTA